MPKIVGKTYIEPDKVMEHVRRAGLPVEEKASFTKVVGEGGRRLYIARTKGVGRVDISGFTLPPGTEGVVDLGDRSFGAVKQQLDFSLDEAHVLRALDAALRAAAGKDGHSKGKRARTGARAAAKHA